MSVKEISSKIDEISFDFLKLLEKSRNHEEKMKIFETYYKTLLILEKVKVSEFKMDK